MTDPQTPATEARICICWIEGYPRLTRHQSECDSYNDGRAAVLREAAERVRALLDATDEAKAGRDAFDPDYYYGYDESLRAVLAILDPETKP